uniref:Uncharacterized protein n=1 Tax=Rhizophora mucronata TaxID=61149 RepID=A0A2P2NFN6_RHIMU
MVKSLGLTPASSIIENMLNAFSWYPFCDSPQTIVVQDITSLSGIPLKTSTA